MSANHDTKPAKSPSHQCVILAGGFGTRLGKLTATTPKPLLAVGDAPFLDRLVEYLKRQNISHAILLAGYLGDRMQDWAAAKSDNNFRIDCLIEPQPAGTAGALHLAGPLLEEEFYCVNGDSFFDIEMSALAHASENEHWLGCLALREVPDVARYGRVELTGSRITGFLEKGRQTGRGLINGGVYYFRRDLLSHLPPAPSSLEHDVFPHLATAGRLNGRVFDGYFIDIGTPDDFDRAQSELGSTKAPK